MKTTPARRAALTCLSLAVLASGLALGQETKPAVGKEGKVEGTLTFNGEAIPLRHAYAVEEMPELNFPGAPKGEFDLILSDKPLADPELECRSLLIHRVRKGEVHGIILTFDPVKKRPRRGNLLHQKGAIFFSILESQDDHKYEPGALTAESVSGKVWMPKEEEVEFIEPGPIKYRYEATVEAPIRRPGPVTATLTGKAAQQSPQAAALLAFCKAGRAGSVAGLRAAGVSAQMAVLNEPEGKELLKMVREGMPDPAKLTVSKVIVRGDRAVLMGKAPKPIESIAVKCFREGGKWKVGMN